MNLPRRTHKSQVHTYTHTHRTRFLGEKLWKRFFPTCEGSIWSSAEKKWDGLAQRTEHFAFSLNPPPSSFSLRETVKRHISKSVKGREDKKLNTSRLREGSWVFHHRADIKEQIDFFSVNCSIEYDLVHWTDNHIPTKGYGDSLLRPPRRVSLMRVVFPLCCWASPFDSLFWILPFLLICLLFCLMTPHPPSSSSSSPRTSSPSLSCGYLGNWFRLLFLSAVREWDKMIELSSCGDDCVCFFIRTSFIYIYIYIYLKDDYVASGLCCIMKLLNWT